MNPKEEYTENTELADQLWREYCRTHSDRALSHYWQTRCRLAEIRRENPGTAFTRTDHDSENTAAAGGLERSEPVPAWYWRKHTFMAIGSGPGGTFVFNRRINDGANILVPRTGHRRRIEVREERPPEFVLFNIAAAVSWGIFPQVNIPEIRAIRREWVRRIRRAVRIDEALGRSEDLLRLPRKDRMFISELTKEVQR